MLPPQRYLSRLVRAALEWPVASQQQARRNAMVALTECAERRAEREEVASYLASLAGARAARADRAAPRVAAPA